MKRKLIVLFLIAFVFRLFLINVAFHGDLYNNLSWGNAAVTHGLNGFYELKDFSHSIPNQPPLYIFLFGLTSFLYKNISNLIWYLNNNVGIFPSSFIWFWQDHGNIILLKLPSIFADLGIGLVIFNFFKKRKRSELGFKLAALWLVNPITWYNSSIWGQTDSIVNLLGLISIFYLLNKKLVIAMVFLTLSLLFKGSLIIFIPIFLLVWILQKYDIKDWVKAVILSGAISIFASVLFHPYIDLPIWLFNLYTQRFFPGEIGYLTANAFNLWYLIDPGKTLDNIKYFGITAHTIGYLITLIIAVAVIVVKRKKITNEKTILYLFALMVVATFLFFTRIHERYLYPFFAVTTILLGLIPEIVIPYLILSFVFLFNMYNLFWAPGIPVLENILKTTGLPVILSVINLAVFVVVVFTFCRQKKI